jgi:hypothetical protein
MSLRAQSSCRYAIGFPVQGFLLFGCPDRIAKKSGRNVALDGICAFLRHLEKKCVTNFRQMFCLLRPRPISSSIRAKSCRRVFWLSWSRTGTVLAEGGQAILTHAFLSQNPWAFASGARTYPILDELVTGVHESLTWSWSGEKKCVWSPWDCG